MYCDGTLEPVRHSCLILGGSLKLSRGIANRNQGSCSHSTAGLRFRRLSCGQATSVLFPDLLNEKGE